MPTFDVHQHLWPEPFVAALRARPRPPRLTDGGRTLVLAREGSFAVDPADHDLARRLALLDRDEIDVAVVSLAPTLGIDALPADERTELVNAYHAGMRDVIGAAGGRLRALAAGSCLDDFAGACIAGGDLVVRWADVQPLLAELERAGQVLFVHPGPGRAPAPAAWWSAVIDYTAEMQAAYAAWLARGVGAYPGLRVVFAILAGGAAIQLERLRSRGVALRPLLEPNVYFETASYGPRALELYLATYGVTQLVYGSDAPVIESTPTLQAVHGFGDAVHTVITSENPTALFA